LRYLEAGIGLGPGGEQRRPFALDGLAIVAQFSQTDDAPAGVGTAGGRALQRRKPALGDVHGTRPRAPLSGCAVERWNRGAAGDPSGALPAVDYPTRS
jgi:hypothetical protein